MVDHCVSWAARMQPPASNQPGQRRLPAPCWLSLERRPCSLEVTVCLFHLFLCLDSHGPRGCGGGPDPPVVILIIKIRFGLCRSDSSTHMSDDSATSGRNSSDRRVVAARRVGATRPTSGTSTVGQVSRSRSDSGRRATGRASTRLLYTPEKQRYTCVRGRDESNQLWRLLDLAHL